MLKFFLPGTCTATNIAKTTRLSAQCLPSLPLTALFPALGLDSWPSRNTSQVKPVKSNLSPSLAGCSGVFVGPEAWIKKFGVKGFTASTHESLTGKVLKLSLVGRMTSVAYEIHSPRYESSFLMD